MSRSVLVTGGTRGIGRAVATAFGALGDRVAVTYRTSGPVPGLLSVCCDVTVPDQVDGAVAAVEEAHGPVEVLVANAGLIDDSLFIRMREDAWANVLDTNLTGAYRVVRRVVPGMLRRRQGRIVLVSSVVALCGSAGQVNYAAAKAGLVGMARSLARELGGRGVTANVVAPGLVDTDMTAGLGARQRAELLARIPAGRAACPEEVAPVVTFLASAGAGYVNGAVVPVDGGLGMGH